MMTFNIKMTNLLSTLLSCVWRLCTLFWTIAVACWIEFNTYIGFVFSDEGEYFSKNEWNPLKGDPSYMRYIYEQLVCILFDEVELRGLLSSWDSELTMEDIIQSRSQSRCYNTTFIDKGG